MTTTKKTTTRTKKAPKEMKLSELQMRILEGHDSELKQSMLRKEYEDMKLKYMIEKHKNYANEIEKQRMEVAHWQKKESQARQNKVGFTDTMVKKFQLKPGWGYDPDSGEIKND